MSKTDRKIQEKMLNRVIKERDRQDTLYGEEELFAHPFLWLRILVEEVGEVAHAIDKGDLEEELVHVVATGLGWLEDIEHEKARVKDHSEWTASISKR